jgi:hypothetical protein
VISATGRAPAHRPPPRPHRARLQHRGSPRDRLLLSDRPGLPGRDSVAPVSGTRSASHVEIRRQPPSSLSQTQSAVTTALMWRHHDSGGLRRIRRRNTAPPCRRHPPRSGGPARGDPNGQLTRSRRARPGARVMPTLHTRPRAASAVVTRHGSPRTPVQSPRAEMPFWARCAGRSRVVLCGSSGGVYVVDVADDSACQMSPRDDQSTSA